MTQRSILRFLGDFSKITVAAKKAARIGQAFSSSFWFNSQSVNALVVKDDVSENGFKYTDGIGKISKDLF
jgi:RNA-dependent RNA polymerase